MAVKMLTMEHQGYYLEKLLDEFVSKSKEILKENLIPGREMKGLTKAEMIYKIYL